MPIATSPQSQPRPRCQLCQAAAAAIHCSSDDAVLCWPCDSKVHSANFLVSRHSRSLLCHKCSSPTPWSASGSVLPSSTFSLCEQCCKRGQQQQQQQQQEVIQQSESGIRVYNRDDEVESESVDEYEDEDGEYSDDEEGDNQVVPWSPEEFSAPSTINSSSTSEGDDEEFNCRINLKRGRDIRNYIPKNGGMSSSEEEAETSADIGGSSDDYRPLKRAMTE